MSVQKIALPMLLFVWLMGSVVHAAPDSQRELDNLYSVAWSPNNQSYATGHDNGTIKIWDASTRELLSTFSIMQDPDPSLIVIELDWSPDSTKIAAAADTPTGYARTQVLDASNGTVLASFDTGVLAGDVAWSPDGSLLAGTFNPGYPAERDWCSKSVGNGDMDGSGKQ
ncbi:MAG TPA: hypothetical protein VHP83_17795 [Aggregatilineaceae bacterium]|nr:hypothetical protein [Aggregatilineaceae bacterium]